VKKNVKVPDSPYAIGFLEGTLSGATMHFALDKNRQIRYRSFTVIRLLK